MVSDDGLTRSIEQSLKIKKPPRKKLFSLLLGLCCWDITWAA